MSLIKVKGKVKEKGSERCSFSTVRKTSPKRMQIVSTLPAMSKAPTVSLFSVLPVKYPAKESPRLWVSWDSSLKSREDG